MKNLTKIIITFSMYFGLFSCSQKENHPETKLDYKSNTAFYKSVTSEEYLKANELQRRFIDQIDAAVNSIDILKKNNPTSDFEAIVNIHKDPKNKLNNSITIGLVDDSIDVRNSKNSRMATPDGKCHVCGVSSAWGCVREVEEYMDKKHTSSITATITRTADGCVDIAYH